MEFTGYAVSKFNPDFWEVTLSHESWRRFSVEDRLSYQAPCEGEERRAQWRRAKELWPEVHALMMEVLTDRQQEVLVLYFLEGCNQREIAERLGISQQSVSERLYGKIRNGRTVGGALRKLRKACHTRGLGWE